MEENYEKFYADIIDMNGTHRITIPKQLLAFVGWKAGDKLKVMAVKKQDGESEQLADETSEE